MAVEERQLLLAVGGVVGRVEVDGDLRGAPLARPPLLLDHSVGQRVGHIPQLGPAHRVLEARQRRLRGQGRPVERIAPDQELVDRIVGQASGVGAVGVATGQPEHPLLEQLLDLMADLAGLPPIEQAPRQPLGQAQVGVDALEQNRAAIRAGMRLIEPRDDRLAFGLESERDLRYTGCGHRASSVGCHEAPRHRFYSTFQRLGGRSVSSFANFAG